MNFYNPQFLLNSFPPNFESEFEGLIIKIQPNKTILSGDIPTLPRHSTFARKLLPLISKMKSSLTSKNGVVPYKNTDEQMKISREISKLFSDYIENLIEPIFPQITYDFSFAKFC